MSIIIGTPPAPQDKLTLVASGEVTGQTSDYTTPAIDLDAVTDGTYYIFRAIAVRTAGAATDEIELLNDADVIVANTNTAAQMSCWFLLFPYAANSCQLQGWQNAAATWTDNAVAVDLSSNTHVHLKLDLGAGNTDNFWWGCWKVSP